MQRIIIGTAGHVDHGKSALTKALTGVDPDRLPEEKARAMTIDLGFVFMNLADQEEVAIIDVPGHERFLKTMIAGATGIRIVLFVVAADESIMPQTREHLDVLRLLGIEQGIVVITKIDKVENDYLAMVEAEVRDLIKGTFLESAPFFKVSTITGQGIGDLKQQLRISCRRLQPLPTNGIFRCPIDRIFTMKGFGPVVAGTVIAGRCLRSESIEILPIQRRVRIRNLQVHNQIVSEVSAGQRAAFNLGDIDITDMERGFELSTPDYLHPRRLVEGKLSLLPDVSRPLRNHERVRLHKGTAEIMGRLIMLDGRDLEPGTEGYVRFRLEKPIVGERQERFLIRSYSPMRVIGGGVFLELYPERRPVGSKKERSAYLKVLETVKDQDAAEMIIRHSSPPIQNDRELMQHSHQSLSELAPRLQRLLQEGVVFRLKDGSLVHRTVLEDLKERVMTSIRGFVRVNPLKVLVGRGDLARSLKIGHGPTLERVLEELIAEGLIELRPDGIKLIGVEMKLAPDTERLANRVEDFIKKSGYNAVRFRGIKEAFAGESELRLKNLFDYLAKADIILEISKDLFIHRAVLEQAQKILSDYLKDKGEIRAVEFKSLLGVSRNVARDFLDFFFNHGITVRSEGTHRLAGGRSADRGS